MIGEANARQNTNNHKKIAAQSLENDENHENNKISKLKLYRAGSVSKNKTVERYGRANKEMKKKKERKKNPQCQYTIEKVS